MDKFLGIIMIAGYIAIMFRLFPKGRRTLDVFKINPFLLPYQLKYVGLLWIAFILIYSGITQNLNPGENKLLLLGLHYGLTIMAFSGEKNEDEFVAQVRMKAMFVSVTTMFLLSGVFASFEIIGSGSFSKNAFVFFLMLFNATLFVYLAYFHFTKYWLIFKRKE